METSAFTTLHCFSNCPPPALSKTPAHFIFISKVYGQVNFDKDMCHSSVSPWHHRDDFHFAPINPYIMATHFHHVMNPYIVATHFHHCYEVVVRQPFSGVLLAEPWPCAEQTAGLGLRGMRSRERKPAWEEVMLASLQQKLRGVASQGQCKSGAPESVSSGQMASLPGLLKQGPLLMG